MPSPIDIEQVKRLAAIAEPNQLIPFWQRMVKTEIVAEDSSTRILAREALAIIEDVWATQTGVLFHTTRDWKVQEYQQFRGFDDLESWRIEGPLKAIGYSVSEADNLSKELRQALLHRLFTGPVPPIFEAGYLAEWGRPGSPSRLKRISDALCTFGLLRAKILPNGKLASSYNKWKADFDYLETLYKKYQFTYGWKYFPRPRS